MLRFADKIALPGRILVLDWTSPRVPHVKQYPGASADHDESHEDPNTMCMFCGVHNDTWDEDALDLHYWRECPMLHACPACSQVSV
jgi:hypothetical protein